jgi:carbon monoxide dehydrogenase subunit G
VPRYVAKVRTARPSDEVFAYLADLRNFASWDPGVSEVVLVEGAPGGADAVYDVTIGDRIELRYEVTAFAPGHRAEVVADNGRFRSVDVITVEADGTGSVATYDAELTLSGFLGFASPLLAPVFKRIGDRAAAGLEQALEGTLVT